MLSYRFWQRRYAGRTDIIGRPLQLIHKTYTIVGVMPPRFTWFRGDVFLPLKPVDDRSHTYFISIRLKPGVSCERANAQLQPLVEQFARLAPERFPTSFRVRIQGAERLGGAQYRRISQPSVRCRGSDAAHRLRERIDTLLSRGAARQHQLAVRPSIGAGRTRIVRQLLTEALGLSVCGALAGVLLARKLIHFIVQWMPERLFPSEATIGINLPVLTFTVAVALLTGVLFGIWPAARLSRSDLSQVMQSGSRGTTSGVLDNTHMKREDRAQYFEQIRANVATPGVVAAGISTHATPPSNGWNTRLKFSARA